ncbi:MAG: hypothetical protein ACKV2T_07040 [Kofleriaceae bacterium]
MAELAHGGLELAHVGHGTGLMNGLGVGLGVLGLPLAGWTMAEGVHNIAEGRTSQGVLDLASGGLGALSSTAGIAAGMGMAGSGGILGGLAMAAPPLAIAAGLAGLGAYGNQYAEDHGWYGENDDGTNASFLGGIGNRAGTGYDIGSSIGTGLLGDNMIGRGLGTGLGVIGGGIGGAVGTVMNAGAAIGGGIARGFNAITDW